MSDITPENVQEKLKIDLEAEDFTSLRAALNSFLGWAYCAESVINHE